MQIKEIYNINYGKGLYTEVVQSAVDECSANGGGIVRFEKGVYVLSTRSEIRGRKTPYK